MRTYFVAFGVGLAVLLQLAVLALSDLSGVSLVSRDSLFRVLYDIVPTQAW